ncbi:MAG: J domain-containing protein [Oscillospiraceae bacterium]|nr:J domain-containing protein [Oscillospiraceae bacterium]
MDNAYRILGVNLNATDEQIKQAYSELSERYRSDAQAIHELNNAYDSVMSERRLNRGTTESSANGGYPYFTSIRHLINANRIEEAEVELQRVPVQGRIAEWHFLMGTVMSRKGWLSEATRYYSNAASMEPGNTEYQQAYSSVVYGRQGQAPGNPYTPYRTSNNNDWLTACIVCNCLSMFCDCCGPRNRCC